MKIYVLNIMTQDGETDGYDADDHVRAILEHAGPGVMDVCIANDEPVPPEIMEPYAKEGVSQLELRRGACRAHVPASGARTLYPP